MKKVALALMTAAFAASALSAPVLAAKKKDAPGKCGTMKFFDKNEEGLCQQGLRFVPIE